MYGVWTQGFWDTLLESNVCLVIVCLSNRLACHALLGVLEYNSIIPERTFLE